MMINRFPGLLTLAFVLVFACKNEPNDEENFFPVISFLNSQVAHVDTSVYAIRKIETRDSISDTQYVQREAFRQLAYDFLNAPDIAQKKIREKYSESKYFDEVLNKVIITYTPIDPDEELQRQEVHIIPNQAEGDKISTIILNTHKATRDSVVQKRLLWQVDERFQVVKTVQKPGEAEKTTTTRVIWNNRN